jgi:RNA polymerase sigma-70 factor (ECF subfamily)
LIGTGVAGRLDLDDQERFASSIEPLLPIAFRLAYAMLRQRDDAEDAVQDAALQAWRKLSTFRPELEIRPWFLAIVANQCRMARRRGRRSLERIEATRETADVDAAGALRTALARLDTGSRLILVLRFYLDLPYDEVGSTLGISAATARVRVHRALRKLRPVIGEWEESSHG